MRRVLPLGFADVLKCEFVPFEADGQLSSLAKSLSDVKYSTDEWNGKR